MIFNYVFLTKIREMVGVVFGPVAKRIVGEKKGL